MDEYPEYWDDWSYYGYTQDTAVVDPPAGDPPAVTDEDLGWIDIGGGAWMNEYTGEVQDEFGNSLGFLEPNGVDEVPQFADPNSGLQPRDGVSDSVDLNVPIDIDTSGGRGGFLDTIGNFFGNLFGGGAPGSGSPGGGGSGGGFGSGGGGSSSSSGNQQQQQMQQMIQQLQQQLAAAQRANATPNVTDALRTQIAALQGGGMSTTQTLLIVGAVGVAIYALTRNRAAA